MRTPQRFWLDLTITYWIYKGEKRAYQLRDYTDKIKDLIWFVRKLIAMPVFIAAAILFMIAQFIDPEVEESYNE